MEDAKKVISEIIESTTKHAVSRKDEISVMKALINDPTFTVQTYTNDQVSDYKPGEEFRKMISNTISACTKITHKEAAELVNQYDFSRSDAVAIVDLSKEFINTYLNTGRKIALGGRTTSDIELMWKEIPDRTVQVPSKNGERTTAEIPAHGGISVSNPCPSWVKKK